MQEFIIIFLLTLGLAYLIFKWLSNKQTESSATKSAKNERSKPTPPIVSEYSIPTLTFETTLHEDFETIRSTVNSILGEYLPENGSTSETPSTDTSKYKGCYERKYILTKNEYQEYKKLREIASRKHLIVCPKVRLLDLIKPQNGLTNYKTLFYKIQAKHVDFVLCDESLYVAAIVELDDKSHDQPDRIERDTFVDTILEDVGYRVIRLRSITEEAFSDI